MDDYLERLIEQLIDDLCDEYELHQESKILWEALVLSGNFSLITDLHYALTETYVLTVPNRGFTRNCRLHNMVLEWCRKREITLFNAPKMIAQLEAAATWRQKETPMIGV